MDTKVLIKIAERFGEDILLDSKKLSSLIEDYIPNDKKSINLLNAGIRNNSAKKLNDIKSLAPDAADREAQITELCRQFAKDYAFTEKEAFQIINCFAAAFKMQEVKFSASKAKPVKAASLDAPATEPVPAPPAAVEGEAAHPSESAESAGVKAKAELPAELMLTDDGKAGIPDILTIFTGVFIVFTLAVLMIALPAQTFSEQENRMLQQFPAISENSFLDRLPGGYFTRDMAEYYADQFPFRDTFVGLKGILEIGLLKGENNDVILAGDNYLITKDIHQNMDAVIDQLRTNIDHIAEFATAMNEMRIPATLAAGGRSIDVLQTYLPPAYPRNNSDRLWSSFNGLADIAPNVRRLDLNAPLRALAERGDRGQIYYRTDHHWTTLGAYYAYAEIIRSFREEGLEPRPLRDFEIVVAANDFYGTTWSKSGMKWINPDSIWFFRYEGDEDFVTTIRDNGREFNGFYDLSYLERKDKYSTFISGNNARVDIVLPGAADRPKMLVIKDSFAHSVVPFLAYHFDLVILDLRYYTASAARIVYEESIDRILFLHNIQNLSEDETYGILQFGVESVLRDFQMDQYDIRRIFINSNPIDDYIIVYPVEENERRQQAHTDAAVALRDMILSKAGVELEIAGASDLSDLSVFDKAIIFTTEGLPFDNNLMQIATEGNNLVFRCNIGTDPTGYAAGRFLQRYIRNATGSFNFGANFIFTDTGDEVIMIMPGRD